MAVPGPPRARSDETGEAARLRVSRAKSVDFVHPHQLGEADEQPVVLDALQLQVAAGLKLAARGARHHERDAVERVRVTLAELAAPDDERVIEHRARAFRD